MKRKLFIFVTALLLFTGCGGNSNLDNKSGLKTLSSMEIKVSPKTIRVGAPAQLSVTVTLSSGEQIGGLTTSFDDPNTNEQLTIRWSSSNEYLAYIDQENLLVPLAPGQILVEARLMGMTQSKTIRIFDSYKPLDSSAPDIGGEIPGDESGEIPEPDEDEAAPCRGHAASIVSFTPGTGAGFGAGSLPDIVLGPPQGAGSVRGSVHVLSLGRYGEIILDLGDCALVDGPGVDLIVFENAFFISGDVDNPYAELGAVAVSEDGVDFFEFSCEQEHFPYMGCAGWNPVYSSSSNDISPFDSASAGGDHFDLQDIGVEFAHYVRIRDLGTPGFGTSVGFDLDAISVVNGIEVKR